MKHTLLVLFGLLFIIVFQACTSDETEAIIEMEPNECRITGAISFSADIVPLLQTYCYFPDGTQSCHATNGSAPGDFSDYDELVSVIDKVRNRAIVVRDMPPTYSSGPLSMEACDVTKLEQWIDEGAMDN